MHNVISIILNKVTAFHIPDMVLKAAFRDELDGVTLESVIYEKIIKGIVLRDCNLYAGKLKKIVLKDTYTKLLEYDPDIYPISNNYSVYEIPPEAREHRDIVSVLDLAYPSLMNNSVPYPDHFLESHSVANIASDALTSHTGDPAYITPTPILMANNTIRLEPPLASHVDWILSCLLAYDENFTNITPNMVEPLTRLVELATKAYIYNRLINDNQLAMLVGGASFDSFTNIIESYSDANELYKEALLKFRGASFFDKDSFIASINMML